MCLLLSRKEHVFDLSDLEFWSSRVAARQCQNVMFHKEGSRFLRLGCAIAF